MGDGGARPAHGTWAARLCRWATHRLYDRLAWAYDPVAWLVSLGQWAEWRRRALDYLPPGRILEVGFGTGELLIEMGRRGMDAYGLDLSPQMHRIVAGKMRRRSVALPVVRADARAIPFAGGSFAAVVATFPAEYIMAPETLREVARVLADASPDGRGGRFVVAGLYVESRSPLLKLMARLVSGSHVQAGVSRFRQAAETAGFRVEVVVEEGRGFRLPVFILHQRQVRNGPPDAGAAV